MRQWDPGHKYAKGPTTSPTYEQLVFVVMQLFVSLCSSLASLCAHFDSLPGQNVFI